MRSGRPVSAPDKRSYCRQAKGGLRFESFRGISGRRAHLRELRGVAVGADVVEKYRREKKANSWAAPGTKAPYGGDRSEAGLSTSPLFSSARSATGDSARSRPAMLKSSNSPLLTR